MPCSRLPLETTTTACTLMRLGAATFSSEASLLQNLLGMTSVCQEDVEAAVAESGCTPAVLLAAYMHNKGLASELTDSSCPVSGRDQEHVALDRQWFLLKDLLRVIENGPIPQSELGSKKTSKSKNKKALLHQNNGQSACMRHANGHLPIGPLQPPARSALPQMAPNFRPCRSVLSDQLLWPMSGAPLHSQDSFGQRILHPSMFGVMGDPWLHAATQLQLNDLMVLNHPALGGALLPSF